MECSADSEMIHLKSIGNLLHRMITGLICLFHAVLQDLTVQVRSNVPHHQRRGAPSGACDC
jgi:hypothetical protein